MKIKSGMNELMVLEFIKWICSFSTQNKEFADYFASIKEVFPFDSLK